MNWGRSMVRLWGWLISGLFILLSTCGSWAQGRRHEVHLEGTPYELHVYRIEGRETRSPTMLIVGGIQGDEPGGFLAADRYVDLTLKRGTLVIVPRANFYSIIKNQRGPHGDMNRRFKEVASRSPMDLVVEILKGLMAEADIFLNLHDGSGFFSPRWESPQRNPMRFGQSIIADASVFFHEPTGRTIFLEAMANRVVDKVNPQIHDERHHFHFNNHRTMDKDTPHKEQRGSATFYALTHLGIPAFGIETSKEIADPRTRVQYQTMVINAFMEEMGIVADHPPLALDPPQLHYVIISVNGDIPFAVPDGGSISVRKGDVVEVRGVVANYQRGITADIVGLGTENDLNKPFRILRNTKVLVRKESQVFGQVSVHVGKAMDGRATETSTQLPEVKYFVVDVEGEQKVVENGGVLKVVRGDGIRILDVICAGGESWEVQVNFIGFINPDEQSPGEDRGVVIDTARDLEKRYALDGRGTIYRVVALRGENMLGEMIVEIQEPRLEYVLVENSGGSLLAYPPGGRLLLGQAKEIKVAGIVTNVPRNSGVEIETRGRGLLRETSSGGWTVKSQGPWPQKGEIIVLRKGIPMGKIFLEAP